MRRMNRKSGQFVDARHGIFADAVSNCVLPFISALPTCASFNRMSLMHDMHTRSRLAAASSALILLALVSFLGELIAIIPVPAMAAIIMVVGANMIDWADIKAHFRHRPEAVVFSASFLSVHVFGLFGAVICGSLLALAYAKWEKAHPNVSLEGNVLRIRGNIYYGSLPVIESLYHLANSDKRFDELVIDFSAVHHIDPEGLRWLAEIGRNGRVRFADRRSGQDRRADAQDRPPDRKRKDRRRRRTL
jgi:SulP family sulfate permease